ncbi:DUF3320 domain-containing protein [Collinsella tanakaei]|nr:DUF3320 domain-containing protein [Collinsella tanakaei]
MPEFADKQSVVALFRYLREVSLIKRKVPTNIRDEKLWNCSLDDLPQDCPFIDVHPVLPLSDEDKESLPLLEVKKPTIRPCPKPAPVLDGWLHKRWDDYRYNGKLNIDSIPLMDEEGTPTGEAIAFDSDDERVDALERWRPLREQWVQDTRIALAAKTLFDGLYLTRSDLERDSETLELLAVNGIIQVSGRPEIYYPVITKRVAISFDAEQNKISVIDTEAPVSLSTDLLGQIEEIDHSSIQQSEKDAAESGLHPFADDAVNQFLKSFAHRLSNNAEYFEFGILPESEDVTVSIIRKPMIMLRKRSDGTPKAIEAIINDIEANGIIPEHIWEIIGRDCEYSPEEYEEPSLEKALAEVGGEDPDILLPKPANREQLEIARRIEKSNAVLVQGPPGTGKTHTTANLLCHFLAQGKRVLITSQTNKALGVLKEKVPRSLQDLCVAVLDDSNSDMEKSIDGIIEYDSTHNEYQLRREIAEVQGRRERIIEDLARTRSAAIGLAAQELRDIDYQGEKIRPVDAARFVHDHAGELEDIVPGKMAFGASIPLDDRELAELYATNESLSVHVEDELNAGVPPLKQLMDPSVFSEKVERLSEVRTSIRRELDSHGWSYESLEDGSSLRVKLSRGFITVDSGRCHDRDTDALQSICARMDKIDAWMVNAAAASRTGADFVRPWQVLLSEIDNLFSVSGKVASAEMTSPVTVKDRDNCDALLPGLRTVEDDFRRDGKISFIHARLNKDVKCALEGVTVSGRQISSAKDCRAAIDYLEYLIRKKSCCGAWNQLIATYGGPRFENLDPSYPERVAKNWMPIISWFVSWDSTGKTEVRETLKTFGIVPRYRAFGGPISDVDSVRDELDYLSSQVFPAVQICLLLQEASGLEAEIKSLEQAIAPYANSALCEVLQRAVSQLLPDDYARYHLELRRVWQHLDEFEKRNGYLERLSVVAPDWAGRIKAREGIHGEAEPPVAIHDAWRWRQYGLALDRLSQGSQRGLREASSQLSREYRSATEALATRKAWLALLERIHGSTRTKQALSGWKLAVRQIGKGTGKNAARDKAIARSRMTECQGAVSAWIMPLGRALESFDPSSTKFDIVIIDEASQADITALSVLYLAKKAIVVGDDKQVSPAAVGADSDRVLNLQQASIKDKVSNWESYKPTTSLYDIALTTFSPLMLREHFRCVPDIIGFCNDLSYDGKIKPLRDAASAGVSPAIVPHRVANGHRDPGRKTNEREACEIAAIVQACIERPEYDGKTFGVISLVGDEQAELVRRKLIGALGESVFEERRILCGNASQFQGDERDVILLSMVDSADESGPLRLLSDGARGDTKKRYNVAVSRARDQLWVVHSLDYETDLKPGDLRRRLLAYAGDPEMRTRLYSQIEHESESPFEESVAKTLVAKGYRISQQEEVGAYRIDIVVYGSDGKVALECDGDRYHSGAEKLRADLERQTILERLGWRFVRVRGSEYYRDPEAAMERIVSELSDLGIEALGNEGKPENSGGSDLLDLIEARVSELISDGNKKLDNHERLDAIEAGLSVEEPQGSEARPQGDDSETRAAVSVDSDKDGEQPAAPHDDAALHFEDDHGVESTFDDEFASNEEGVVVEGSSRVAKEEENAEAEDAHGASNDVVNTGISDDSASDYIVDMLKANGQQAIDRRSAGGRLWVIDQYGTREVISNIERMFGLKFRFVEGGSRTTEWKQSWYLLDDGVKVPVASGGDSRKASRPQSAPVAPKNKRNVFHRRKYETAPMTKKANLSGVDFCQPSRVGDIASVMEGIIEVESPIEKNRLFSLTRGCYGIKKTGANIYAQCDAALNRMSNIERTSFDGSVFVWKRGDSPSDVDYFRAGNADAGRSIDQIAPEELRAAIMYALSTAKTQIGAGDLIKRTSTLLGYRRLGGAIQGKLQNVLGIMLKHGDIVELARGYYQIKR